MYAIIGARGYLGSYVRKVILEDLEDDLICVGLNINNDENNPRVKWLYCDITSQQDVDKLLNEFKQYENLKIVYLAAYHNPDLVQTHKELAWNINVNCLRYFIENAYFVNKIYYVSTDSVYGESVDFYHFKEDDPLNPVNYYGENKVAAEKIMYEHNRNCVRFPFLISPSLTNKPHFYDQIVDSLKHNQPFEMYRDSYRSSLSFENAARLLISLIENDNPNKVVNVCGDQDLSKYDVGLLIAKKEKLNPELIVPITMSKVVDNFVSKRATSTLLDNSLLKKTLNLEYVDIFERPVYK